MRTIDGGRVKERRNYMRLKQHQLAQLVGVSQATIARIENGEVVDPRKLNVKALLKALDTTEDYLFTESESTGEVHIEPVPEPVLPKPIDQMAPFEKALFAAMDHEKFEPRDFDAVRESLRETHFLLKKDADLAEMMRSLLVAAKQLRVEGHKPTATAIMARAAEGKGELARKKAAEMEALLREEMEQLAREHQIDSTEEEREQRAKEFKARLERVLQKRRSTDIFDE